MSVKQISVFLENQSGRLADVTKALAAQHIDINALSIADTTHFGILRLIVNKPAEAETVLKDCGYTVSLSDVLAVAIEDTPGALAEVLDFLTDAKIGVEYIYAFLSKTHGKAFVILKVENLTEATAVLRANQVEVLEEAEVYRL